MTCNDRVCLTLVETTDLARWIAKVLEAKDAIGGCTLVDKKPW